MMIFDVSMYWNTLLYEIDILNFAKQFHKNNPQPIWIGITFANSIYN